MTYLPNLNISSEVWSSYTTSYAQTKQKQFLTTLEIFRLQCRYQRVRFFGVICIRINDPGSFCLKATDGSILVKDLLVPLMHHGLYSFHCSTGFMAKALLPYFPFSRRQNLSSTQEPRPLFWASAFNPANSANILANTAKDECSSVIGKRTRSSSRKLSEPTDL